MVRSYRAAMNELGNGEKQEIGRLANNRAENSHLPFRQRGRAMLRFQQNKDAAEVRIRPRQHRQSFQPGASSPRSSDYKQRRSAAFAEWQVLTS
jgi:putative transposase